MLSEIRQAWAKVVDANVTWVDYHWPDAVKPHRTEFRLDEIPRVFDDADEFFAELGEE